MKRRVHPAGPLLACALVAAAALPLEASRRAFPNTYVGAVSVGLRTRGEIADTLRSSAASSVRFEIQNEPFTMELSQMGIETDVDALVGEIMAPNGKPFAFLSWILSLTHPRRIAPKLAFTKNYDAFVDSMSERFSGGDATVVIDNEAKQVISLSDVPTIGIDSQDFRTKIADAYGRNDMRPIRPRTYPVRTDRDEIIETANAKLKETFGRDLSFDITDTENRKHILMSFTPEELKTIATIPDGQSLGSITFGVNQAAFSAAVAGKLKALGLGPMTVGTVSRIGSGLTDSLRARYYGNGSDTVHLSLGDMPNTDGRRDERYIEVDLSQQRMYLFNKGQMAATYRVSSGLDWPTPPGSYKILNKAPNPFSKIYNVFMPYWMAFYFDPKLGASLGIHELPYWVDETGKKIQRPRDFIGSPHTGGCIALDVGVAREVYAFADVGTPLYIFR